MPRLPQIYKGKHLEAVRRARDMFVQGLANGEGELEFPAIASLVEVAGVSKVTLYSIAEKEDWKGDRIKVQMAIRHKRDADHAALAVREGKKLDEGCIEAAQGLIKEVRRRVNGLDANGLDKAGKPLKAATAQQLSNTLKTAQHVGKLAIGEPTEYNGDFTDDETVRAFTRILDQYAVERAKASLPSHPRLDPAGESEPDSAA